MTTQTVTNAATISDSADGLAYALRGQAALTMALQDNMQVTLAGSAEYLSRVAAVSHAGLGAPTITEPGAGDLTYTGPGTSDTSLLSFGDMWNVSGSISLTGQF